LPKFFYWKIVFFKYFFLHDRCLQYFICLSLFFSLQNCSLAWITSLLVRFWSFALFLKLAFPLVVDQYQSIIPHFSRLFRANFLLHWERHLLVIALGLCDSCSTTLLLAFWYYFTEMLPGELHANYLCVWLALINRKKACFQHGNTSLFEISFNFFSWKIRVSKHDYSLVACAFFIN